MVLIPNHMHKKIYLLTTMIFLSYLGLQAQITLKFPNQDIRCQETITFPVVVEDYVGVRGGQFSINWDTTALQYQGSANVNITPNPNINIDSIANGKLALSWFSANLDTLQDGDTLFTLDLLVKNANLNNLPLALSDDFVPNLITLSINNRLQELPANIENGGLNLIDTDAPTITCPAAQTVVNTGGNSTVVINGLSPTNVADNCGIIDSLLYVFSGATMGNGMNDASGIAFEVGTTDVTYTVKDTKGNTETCTTQITVNSAGTTSTLGVGLNAVTATCTDTIVMPISVSDFDSITSLGLSLGWDTNTCDFAVASMSVADFDVTQSASGIITLAWMDAMPQSLANQATLFNLRLVPISVVNNSPVIISNESAAKNNAGIPVSISGQGTATATTNNFQINCPTNVVVPIIAGQTQVAVSNIGLGMISGNCGNTTTTYTLSGATTGGGVNDASGTLFNIGTTTVTYVVENAVGEQATCSFSVEVNGQAVNNFTLIAESKDATCDETDISININVAAFDNISGTEFSINWDPNVLNYTTTDNQLFTNGNFGPIDNTNGRINYSWFDNTSTGQTLEDGTTLFTMHFTSSGGGMSNIEFSDIPNAIEITQRENGAPVIIARDSIILQSGKVTIIDTVPPTITCFNDVVLSLPLGTDNTVLNGIDFSNPMDNCGVDSIYYTITGTTSGSGAGSASGTTFQAGISTVTYTVVDNVGLTGTCQFQVSLSAPSAINVTPTVTDAECGEDAYRVDIVVDSFTNTAGLQFTFEWDNTILEYASKGNFGLPEFDNWSSRQYLKLYFYGCYCRTRGNN